MIIGFIGLGKMGLGMANRLVAAGHEVHGYAPSESTRKSASENGITTHDSATQMVESLGDKPIVWMMIPAQYVREQFTQLLEDMPPQSILVDGGNSRFEQSVELAKTAQEKQVNFIDVGVSGGVGGEKQGYCMMAGGDPEAFSHIEPAIIDMSQEGGYGLVGPSGAGHFVKMAHNAIEYGMMEAYAEGYELIKQGPFTDIDSGKLARLWQNGSIVQSYLNGLAAEVLTANPELDGVEGQVNMLGEAQWASEYAAEKGIEFATINHSIEKRAASQSGKTSYGTKFLAALRHAFGGHDLKKTS